MAVEELYCSLNKLLQDICKFLADETNYENLSPSARKQADELINRSKHQLQEITKINIENNDYCDGAYVDMEKKSVENEDDKDNIYSSVDEVIQLNPTITQNPYATLPARELSQDVKYGTLSWRCRIILKFEKIRRIYAGVHNNWLLVYSSEKDCKPIQTFYLKFHKAQNVRSKQGKELPQDFELVTTLGERKSYYFIALTHKDMLQWISHINRSYDSLNKTDNISIADENISENYDIIAELRSKENNESEDEEVIYQDLDQNIKDFPPNNHVKNLNIPPELPMRRPLKTIASPLPQREENRDSTDSAETTYDPVISESFDKSSFSEEDEEDNVYEVLVTKVPEGDTNFTINKTQNNNVKLEENSDITTEKQLLSEKKKPETPIKPKFIKEKPKSFCLLKK